MIKFIYINKLTNTLSNYDLLIIEELKYENI